VDRLGILIDKSDETRTNWLLAKVILSLLKGALAVLAPENPLEIALRRAQGDFLLGTQCPISNCVLYKKGGCWNGSPSNGFSNFVTRLPTLLGPDGAGQTRLMLQVAEEVIDDYADGV
jgi:hypothetical protein